MRQPNELPFYVAVTIRGEPADLQEFQDRAFHPDDGALFFAPEKLMPSPAEFDLVDDDFHAGREEMILVCLADGRPIPDDGPPEGRASQMLNFLALPDPDPRALPVDRWFTMCQAAGLPTSSDEATIATAWLRLNPDDRAIGVERLQRIQNTGYANASCWMADHWGCAGLGSRPVEFTPASETEGPSIYLALVGSAGAPDLLFQQLARDFPRIRFEMSVAYGPGLYWIIELQGDAMTKRHPKDVQDAAKAMLHLRLIAPSEVDEVMMLQGAAPEPELETAGA